jgi:multimeric flavodoxin WrbA
MKISIINGSPRKKGATAGLLHEVERHLKTKNDVSIFFYDLADIDMRFCSGCEACYSQGNCVIKNDKLNSIVNNVKQSDAIVIGTPTHGSNVSAMLKNFMDRGHFIVEQSLYGKKCMSLTSYEIADGSSAQKILNKFFVVSGGTVIRSHLVKVGFNKNPLNLKLKKRIEKSTDKLYHSVKNNKTKSMFEFVFNDIIVVGIIWKSFFKKNPEQFYGVLNNYKKAGIHKHLHGLCQD